MGPLCNKIKTYTIYNSKQKKSLLYKVVCHHMINLDYCVNRKNKAK